MPPTGGVMFDGRRRGISKRWVLFLLTAFGVAESIGRVCDKDVHSSVLITLNVAFSSLFFFFCFIERQE
jgi:hypothetical protein